MKLKSAAAVVTMGGAKASRHPALPLSFSMKPCQPCRTVPPYLAALQKILLSLFETALVVGGLWFVLDGVSGACTCSCEVARVQHSNFLVQVMGRNNRLSPRLMGPHGPEPKLSLLPYGHPQDLPASPRALPKEEPVITASGGMTVWAGPWGISYATHY
jgi:hypothetical protein